MGVLQILSIIFFFVIMFGTGYTVLYFSKTKRHQHQLLALLETFAVGFATVSFLGIILDLLHIPLHNSIYLIISLIGPITALIKKEKPESNTWFGKEAVYIGILLIIMIGMFSTYHKGAFAYPYFEDDDPWNYAQGALFVAREHTANPDAENYATGGYARYISPYPPSYTIIMGVLRQINDSVVWTLKFFNVLMITIALAFYYLFFLLYTKSNIKAIFGVFLLAVLPSFMSHFIWSQTLALTIFPVALYALLKAIDDKSWRIPAVIAIAAMFVSQVAVTLVFMTVVTLLLAVLFLHELTSKSGNWKHRFSKTITGALLSIIGAGASLLFWGVQLVFGDNLSGETSNFFSAYTSGYTQIAYTWREIFLAPPSRIDQAVGWGVPITLLLFASVVVILILGKKTLKISKDWTYLHLLLWLFVLAYTVLAPTFGLPGFGSSRAWAYLAIPVALVVTEGTYIIAKSMARRPIIVIAAIAVVAAVIGLMTIPAKVQMQTSQWPPGVQWTANEELMGYIGMGQNLPKNSRVYPLCSGEQKVIGFDMQSDPWDHDQAAFRAKGLNITGEELTTFMALHNYEYLTIDFSCVQQFGPNATMNIAQELSTMQRYQQMSSSPGFLLARFVG